MFEHKPLGKVLDFHKVYVTGVAVDQYPIWLSLWGATSNLQAIHSMVAAKKQINLDIGMPLPMLLPDDVKVIARSQYHKNEDKTSMCLYTEGFLLNDLNKAGKYVFFFSEEEFIETLGTVLKHTLPVPVFPQWYSLLYHEICNSLNKEVKTLIRNVTLTKGLPVVKYISLDKARWTSFIQELIHYRILEIPYLGD